MSPHVLLIFLFSCVLCFCLLFSFTSAASPSSSDLFLPPLLLTPSSGCYWSTCQSKWLRGCEAGQVSADQSDNCNGVCDTDPPCLPFHSHFRCCIPEKFKWVGGSWMECSPPCDGESATVTLLVMEVLLMHQSSTIPWMIAVALCMICRLDKKLATHNDAMNLFRLCQPKAGRKQGCQVGL